MVLVQPLIVTCNIKIVTKLEVCELTTVILKCYEMAIIAIIIIFEHL